MNDLDVDRDMIEERHIHEALAMLRLCYEKAAKPYLDRLVTIHSMRPPSPMIVTREQAEARRSMTANAGITGRDGIKRWTDNGEQVDRPTEKRMAFDEWADKYALNDEPCTRHSRRQDCEAAWKAATEQAIEAMHHLDYGRWSKDEIREHIRVFCA